MLDDGKPVFHFTCTKWSPSVYKYLLDQFLDACSLLKDMGFDKVYSIIPKGDGKLYKFQTMFCFIPYADSDTHHMFVRSI